MSRTGQIGPSDPNFTSRFPRISRLRPPPVIFNYFGGAEHVNIAFVKNVRSFDFFLFLAMKILWKKIPSLFPTILFLEFASSVSTLMRPWFPFLRSLTDQPIYHIGPRRQSSARSASGARQDWRFSSRSSDTAGRAAGRSISSARNSRIRFIGTVSPVPLIAAAEDRSVLVSTTSHRTVWVPRRWKHSTQARPAQLPAARVASRT